MVMVMMIKIMIIIIINTNFKKVSYCKTELSLPSSQALSWSNKLFFLFPVHLICTDFLAFPSANDSAENF